MRAQIVSAIAGAIITIVAVGVLDYLAQATVFYDMSGRVDYTQSTFLVHAPGWNRQTLVAEIPEALDANNTGVLCAYLRALPVADATFEFDWARDVSAPQWIPGRHRFLFASTMVMSPGANCWQMLVK